MDGKCSARNKDGRPCSAHAWADGLCRWHHPDLETQRTEGRRKGGAARANAARAKRRLPADVLSVDDVRGVVGRTITSVLAGDVEPGVGNCVANLARVALMAAEHSALADLDTRLAGIEALAATEPA